MKKMVLAAFAAALLCSGTLLTSTDAHAGHDDSVALQLSILMPGVGEWYNSGFSGGFPFVECIVGTICPCIHLASMFDAAAGKTDSGFRVDFWRNICRIAVVRRT